MPPREITLVSVLFGTTRLLFTVPRTLCATGGGWSAQPWPTEGHRAADEGPDKAHHRKLGAFSLEALGHWGSHKSHNSLHWEMVEWVLLAKVSQQKTWCVSGKSCWLQSAGKLWGDLPSLMGCAKLPN